VNRDSGNDEKENQSFAANYLHYLVGRCFNQLSDTQAQEFKALLKAAIDWTR
jgi:hypothetical protein